MAEAAVSPALAESARARLRAESAIGGVNPSVVAAQAQLEQARFPIGTQGRAAIYTSTTGGFPILRRIGIRAYTWFNWLYPFSG